MPNWISKEARARYRKKRDRAEWLDKHLPWFHSIRQWAIADTRSALAGSCIFASLTGVSSGAVAYYAARLLGVGNEWPWAVIVGGSLVTISLWRSRERWVEVWAAEVHYRQGKEYHIAQDGIKQKAIAQEKTRIYEQRLSVRGPVTVRVIGQEPSGGGVWGKFLNPGVALPMLIDFADSVLEGAPTTEDYWTGEEKLFPRNKFRRMRDEFIHHRLAEWVNPSRPQKGWRFTRLGLAALRTISREIPPDTVHTLSNPVSIPTYPAPEIDALDA